MYFGRKAVGITAMAAVDMALWDLKGKAFGQPIHRLLGGKQHDRLRGYASILFGRDGQETGDIARKWVEAGYTAVKFGWEPMGTSEAVDIDLVRGARDGLGDATLNGRELAVRSYLEDHVFPCLIGRDPQRCV